MAVESKSITYEELDSVTSFVEILRLLDRLKWPTTLHVPGWIHYKWRFYLESREIDQAGEALVIGSTRVYAGNNGEAIDLSDLHPSVTEPTSPSEQEKPEEESFF